MGEEAFKYFKVPFNKWTRWVLDPCLHGRTMVHAFHKAGPMTKYVCKDLMVPKIPSEESDSEPYPRAKSLFLALDKDWGHYPIHLCPGSMSAQGPYGALVPRFLTNNPYLTTGISIGFTVKALPARKTS